jgi:hypothetical protein
MKEGQDNKIDEILNSLDGLQRAEANPFLWGKIRNRLENRQQFVPSTLAWKLAIALAVVVVMNLLTIQHFQKGSVNDRGIELVANEYSISLPQTY